MKMNNTICIDAPKERVWAVLADVVSVADWVEQIYQADYGSVQKHGVGTQRVCHLTGGITLEETWTEWEEGEFYTYEATGMPMIKEARNRWSVEEVNGQTFLTSNAELVPKGGVLGQIVVPIFRWWSTRLGSDSMARFKYLAENGRPYKGDGSDLPVASATC